MLGIYWIANGIFAIVAMFYVGSFDEDPDGDLFCGFENMRNEGFNLFQLFLFLILLPETLLVLSIYLIYRFCKLLSCIKLNYKK